MQQNDHEAKNAKSSKRAPNTCRDCMMRSHHGAAAPVGRRDGIFVASELNIATGASTTMSYRILCLGTGLALIILCAICPKASLAGSLAWGVNGPDGRRADVEKIFSLMHVRGLTQYRVGANLAKDTDPYEVQMYKDMIVLAKAHGISLKPVLAVPFGWGDRTDAGQYPAGDRAALYRQGYIRTYNFVTNFKDDINDWEMGNEINLLALDGAGKKLFGRGWTAAEFDTPAMNDWAAVLKGMSDAIDRINKEHGLHLRRTLNTTSTMFGFLDFMAQRGVGFDVISFHYYEKEGISPLRAWGGTRPQFDLFKMLASYRKPVIFNEVNCSEIYQNDYENEAGKPKTEACYRSFYNTLSDINRQAELNIEAVCVYELLDEPAKKPPESRFGMLYDINSPKVPFFILTHFAGGRLSAPEIGELARRGFAR